MRKVKVERAVFETCFAPVVARAFNLRRVTDASSELTSSTECYPLFNCKYMPHTQWRQDYAAALHVSTPSTYHYHGLQSLTLIDAPGATFLSYTPNGRKLITVGSNGALRVFQHGSDDEPAVIDVVSENHTAVAATNDFFVIGTEDGTVAKYSLLTNSMEQILVRCSLPVRDVALSRDGQWAAVASDELEVKVVNTHDMTRVMYVREQSRPVKHVSFDSSGSTLAVSCSDGIVYMYSLSSEQPQLLKRVDGLIKTLETDAEASAKVAWHPDGRAFAAPTASRGNLPSSRCTLRRIAC